MKSKTRMLVQVLLVLALVVSGLALTTPTEASVISVYMRTIPESPNIYYPGDTVYYEITVMNPPENTATNTLDRIWATLPNGTVIEFLYQGSPYGNANDGQWLVQEPGDVDTFYVQYVVADADLWWVVPHNPSIDPFWGVRTRFEVEGGDSQGDRIWALVERTSRVIRPNTEVSITASPETVVSGGSATLTVVAENTGWDELTNPYVEVRKNGTLHATLAAPPDSGDTNSNGALDVGETWTWAASSGAITTATTFEALGFGTDPANNEVSYAEGYSLARDEVTVNISGSLLLTISSTAGGTVTTPGEGTFSYDAGTMVNLTAMPDTGYHFVNWTGDDSTIDNVNSASTTITMNDDYSITANFAIDQYTLTYHAAPGGSIGGTTPQTVSHGSDGTPVEAVPDTGYHFVDWSDSSTDNPRIDTNVTGDISVTANFAPDDHYLTISSIDGGSVTLPGEGTYLYAYGTVVNLVAAPVIGHQFVNWTGDVSTVSSVGSAETTITMNGDYSIVANFEPVAGVQTECVESTTGTGEACLTTSHGVLEDLEAIAPHSLPSVLFPHGMFDFKITGLTEGQTVTLTIEFPSPLPIGTLWWKYDNGRWYALPNESDNGDHIMVISLTDGGVHDLDDVPGQITDPGGPGNPMTVGWDGSPVSKSVVLWPWIAFLAAIMAGASLLMLRRRRGQEHI